VLLSRQSAGEKVDMRRQNRIMLSALSCLLFSSCTIAQGQRGVGDSFNKVSLSGIVFSDQKHEPIDQAMISLCDTGGTLIAQTATNDSGEFSIRGLTMTNYIVRVEANGFQTEELHIDLSFNSDRGMDIFLKPNVKSDTTPSSSSSVSAHEMSMPQQARGLMASGIKKIYQDKDPKAGLADLEQATEIAPGYYEAYYQIAMAQLGLNNNDDAAKAFQKSIQVSGDKYGEAEIGLGTLMLNKGDNPGGEKAIRKGIELSPNFWFGYYELGRALLNDKQVADAEKAGLQARSLAPGAPLVYRLLAVIHMDEKNYPALLDDLDEYIKLDPDSPAGQRAKELRTEVAQKIGDQKQNPTASPSN
jgi:Tfp pilus assembly protein PilF